MRWLLICAALLPCAARAGIAIVLNSGGASMSIVDMATGAERSRVPVLREPHHMILTPDGRTLIVGDTAGNELLFVDPASGAIERRLPVADPYQLGYSPDGKLLTVTGLARNQVDVYDVPSYALRHRFPLSSMPSHLAYAPDGSVVYVSLQGSDHLVALDLHAMTVLWNVDVGHTPAGVLWLNGRVLVADMGADDVAVVDPADGHVERRIHTGRGAHQVVLSPDRTILYVNNRVDGTTVALDAATLAERRRYAVPGGPDCIAFAPDGKLWITQRFAQGVAVLDPVSGALVSHRVGRSPHGLFVNAAAP